MVTTVASREVSGAASRATAEWIAPRRTEPRKWSLWIWIAEIAAVQIDAPSRSLSSGVVEGEDSVNQTQPCSLITSVATLTPRHLFFVFTRHHWCGVSTLRRSLAVDVL